MTKLTFIGPARSALIATSVILASLAFGQMNGASSGAYPGNDGSRAWRDADSLEAGTIPAARPGLPQRSSRGAQGPIRSDAPGYAHTDPSIRDNNPLTVNGLWETLPGNRITSPSPQ